MAPKSRLLVTKGHRVYALGVLPDGRLASASRPTPTTGRQAAF